MNNIPEQTKKIHLIAIGGAAMHNLALALHNNGFSVSGSDDEIFEPSLSRLKQHDLLPEKFGWNPNKITSDIDMVILGMHARKDNPELLKAQELNLKIYSYPEFLFQQTRYKKRVVIAGSHGKTTITAMVMHVLKANKVEFDYMVGSQIDSFDTMVSLKEHTKLAIFEGDEYLSSPIDLKPKFLHYKPHIAVISGIAWDHINVFPTFEMYMEQFKSFVRSIRTSGSLIFYQPDKHVTQIVADLNYPMKKIPYQQLKHEQDNIGIQVFDKSNKAYPIKIFGDHNLQNLSAAYQVCRQLAITDSGFFTAITSFNGTKKRLQFLAEKNGSMVFSDFAHSPSKLKATIEAVKKRYPGKKLVACFELHTFSSLNARFLNEYRNTMEQADEALVYYNPEVIEHKKLEFFDANNVAKAFNKQGLKVFQDTAGLANELRKIGNPAVFLMMSSGNFGGLDINKILD